MIQTDELINVLAGQSKLQIDLVNLLRQIEDDYESSEVYDNVPLKKEVVKQMEECEKLLEKYESNLYDLIKLNKEFITHLENEKEELESQIR